MAKKAEQEACYIKYSACVEMVRRAVADHHYLIALRQSQDSLQVAWDAVAYQRRYRKIEMPDLPTVSVLLKYAPPLFAWRELDALEIWLKAAKRTDKLLYSRLPGELEAARQKMTFASELWADLDSAFPDPVETLCHSDAEDIVAAWLAPGTVAAVRSSGRIVYRHITHPQGSVAAKCASCGRLTRLGWADFLEPARCSGCRQIVRFVALRRIF